MSHLPIGAKEFGKTLRESCYHSVRLRLGKASQGAFSGYGARRDGLVSGTCDIAQASNAFFHLTLLCVTQVRYSALLVCDKLFCRSKQFRALLAARFKVCVASVRSCHVFSAVVQEFVDLVVGKPMRSLPLPVAAARLLRAKALKLIASWHKVLLLSALGHNGL